MGVFAQKSLPPSSVCLKKSSSKERSWGLSYTPNLRLLCREVSAPLSVVWVTASSLSTRYRLCRREQKRFAGKDRTVLTCPPLTGAATKGGQVSLLFFVTVCVSIPNLKPLICIENFCLITVFIERIDHPFDFLYVPIERFRIFNQR